MKKRSLRKSKTQRIISIIASIFIVIGIAIAIYPFVKEFYLNTLNPPDTVDYDIPQTTEPEVPAEAPVTVYPEKLPEDSTAVLEIPKIDLEVDVFYGTTEEDLKQGPGFFPQSGYPDTGNVCIAGHRNAHGSPFWYLDKLETGDAIFLYYEGNEYYYEVEENYVTDPKDWSIVDPTPEPAITLQTCTPLWPVDGKYDRLIIRGYLKSKSACEENGSSDIQQNISKEPSP